MVLVMAMFVGCGGNASEGGSGEDVVYELSWAGIGSTDSIDTWIGEEAAKRISEKTDGKVKINVYPASQLGDITQAYDEIMQGTIDMGLFTIYGTYDIFCEVLYTPFLTSNYDEFKEIYGRDGVLYQTYQEVQDEYGISLLGFWPSGYLGVGFAKINDTSTLFDFDVKKKDLVRAPGMDSMILSVESMGFNSTVINYADVYTALQTGVCDGSWNGGAYANYTSFRDVLNYFVDYRACNDVYCCIMNSEKMGSLPKEYQEIISQVIEEVIDDGIAKIEAQDEQSIQDMKDYGIEVISPTDAQRVTMRDYFVSNVWPQLYKFYGEEFMTQLADEVSSL
jgi:TRAP-type C4-dicarboxylate transport system substrate-binding protein